MNLVAVVSGHRPGIEYSFAQAIQFRRCMRFTPALGGNWQQVDSQGPGYPDSPVSDAMCPVPDAHNEITMTDAPGFRLALGQAGPPPGVQELSSRANAVNWIIAREGRGKWHRISDLFRWYSVTRIRRNAAGNWELSPAGNAIGRGSVKIGGCPPPVS
jgi:hypothetical protein